MSEDYERKGSVREMNPRVTLDGAQLERLDSALAKLRPRDRAIYFAACRDRLPYAEIARQHGITATKVERLLSRTLVKLHAAVWRSDAP